MITETIEKPIETPEIVLKTKYTPIKNPTARHEAVKTLLEHSSLSQAQIGEQLNYNPDYVRELKKKLSKTSIISTKMLKLAKIRLKEILELEPMKQERILKEKTSEGFTETIEEFNQYPSHGNVLEAIKTVVDRSEPVTQKLDVTNKLELGELLVRAMERKRKALDA